MTFHKTCKICGNEFESESRNKSYCSDKCAKRGAKKAAKRRKMKSNFSEEHATEKSLDKLVQRAYVLSREIAIALIPQKCSCTDPNHVCDKELQVHHIDHNPLNMSPSNLRWLCVKAHAELHSQEEDVDLLNELKAYATIKEQTEIRERNLERQRKKAAELETVTE